MSQKLKLEISEGPHIDIIKCRKITQKKLRNESETEELRLLRLEKRRAKTKFNLSKETEEDRQNRLEKRRLRYKERKDSQSEEDCLLQLINLRKREKLRRLNETEEERQSRLCKLKERGKIRRSNESEEERKSRLDSLKEYMKVQRSNETEEERHSRLNDLKRHEKVRLSNETDEERLFRLNDLKRREKERLSNEGKEERQSRLTDLKRREKVRLLTERAEERQSRLHDLNEREKVRRYNETKEKREKRLKCNRDRDKLSRAMEDKEKRQARLQMLSNRIKLRLANETLEQRLSRLEQLRRRNRARIAKQSEIDCFLRLQDLRERNKLRLQNQTVEERRCRIQNLKEKIKAGLRKIGSRSVPVSEEHQQDMQNIVNMRLSKLKSRNSAVYADIDESVVSEDYCGKMNIRCRHCDSVNFANECVFRKDKESEFSLCCQKGKIRLERLREFPEVLKDLMTGSNKASPNFSANIRQYNSAFACASFGANIVVPPGFGKYCFKIQGQIYYRTGPLKPNDSNSPTFAQVYVLDPEDADAIRCNHTSNTKCDANVMSLLDRLFREINPYAQSWMMMKEVLNEEERQANDRGELARPVEMVIVHNALLDSRRYNPQRANEVAMVFVSKDGVPPIDRAFIAIPITTKEKKYLNFMNPNLDPMLYPIIFPRGDLGWHNQIMQWDPITQMHTTERVTQMQFYSYKLATRVDVNKEIIFNPLLNAGKLTQQYIVDAYTKVEANRLKWIRDNQSELRVENYKLLEDHIANSTNAENIPIGKPVILPSSFQNGPRALTQNFQDAMAIVARYGKPDLFITFTCNPKWREIVENLNGQSSENRPDLIARVFHLKLKALIKDLTDNMILGTVLAFVYTIEFQKRGLPHAHILLILDEKDKIRNNERIDGLVSAEIPIQKNNPKLFETVTTHMLHGPCGVEFPTSPCMEEFKENVLDEAGQPTFDENGLTVTRLNWKCTKNFPKDFQETTLANFNGYPLYRRRRMGETFTKTKQGIQVVMDNRNVVPYNPYLSLKYNAHINVEICSSIKAVKYVFKYVYKGYDCANIEIGCDEIKTFLDCRYVSAPEAMWRLCGYPMHQHSHAIYRFPVHLDGQQPIYFQEGEETTAIERAANRLTKLSAWFKLNAEDESAKQYLYPDIPYHYTWHPKEALWKKRKRNHRLISRMYTVSPSDMERYHLRLLLLHVKGAESYEDLKTVTIEDRVVFCQSFQEACQKLGLLDDDKEWDNCLRECSQFQMPKQLRKLFSYILVFCQPAEPLVLWNNYKEKLMEDYLFLYPQQQDFALYRTLFDIKNVLNMSHKELSDYEIPEPAAELMMPSIDNSTVTAREKEDSERRILLLNDDQKHAFYSIVNAIDDESVSQRLFYLDGPGGSGKTFLYNTILTFLKCRGDLAFPIAWTGIASTLLIGGHSCFGLPVPINETSSCRSKSKEDDLKLKQGKLILWDEATMVPLYALQAIDRRLREIMNNKNTPFGGKVILMGGDFRQTLPVVPRAKPTEILEQCITKFAFWKDFVQLKLKVNMRNADDEDKNFSEWLLKLGDGSLPRINELPENIIHVPNEFITDNIVDSIFGQNITVNEIADMSSRAILCPLNEDVLKLNDDIIDRLEGTSKLYLSSDTALDKKELGETTSFPTEFLNSLTPSGMAPHKLKLKIGAIVMLLRNLDFGLCNGTRLIVRKMHQYSLQAEVLTGNQKGEIVFIPRITVNPSESYLPFILKRKQLPIRVAFAMTINKAQGQSLKMVGIYLRKAVFSHGQLYVAFSRATLKSGVKVKILDSSNQGRLLPRSNEIYTYNVVYRSILQTE